MRLRHQDRANSFPSDFKKKTILIKGIRTSLPPISIVLKTYTPLIDICLRMDAYIATPKKFNKQD